MTDQEKREKVIALLERYADFPNLAGAENYGDKIVDVPASLIADVLALLKAQKDTRLTPRKPYHTRVAYRDENSEDGFRYLITDQCPKCVDRGKLGIWDTLVDRHKKYCRRCGQAIDWSEYDGREQIDWDEYMRRGGRWNND